MELSSHQEGQIPISIPINSSSYGAGGHGHGHMIPPHHHHEPAAHTLIPNNHHNHLITSSAPPVVAPPPPPPPQSQIPASINNNGSSIPNPRSPDQEDDDEEHVNHVNVAYNHNNNNNHSSRNNNKKVVNSSIKYKECLKNHAAAMGGTATDGCGEFMPSGEEGTIEALTCSACNCHRNFHRKEVEGDHGLSSWEVNSNSTRVGRKVLLGHPNGHKNMSILAADALGFHTAANPTGGFLPSRTAPHHHHHHHPHQMIMSYNNNMGMGGLMGSHLPSESDEQEQDQVHHHGHGGGVNVASRVPVQQLVKKRFRTKFTQEQKEKMFNFAEKVGWKIQKQEESVVQNFCHEIGVKRRVLKVWMHNNKHNLAKNKSQPPPSTTA